MRPSGSWFPASMGVAIVAATMMMACDGSPDRPSHLSHFRVAGPSEVAPGSSARFEAILDRVATLTDVSAQAQWSSSNPSVLSVDAGLATGRTSGEAIVTARFEEDESAPRPIMVLPPGTYRVRGRVLFAGTASTPVVTARVEVPSVGLVTTTDSQGRFTLYGVPPDAAVQAVKQGYAVTTTSVRPTDHDQQISMTLRPALQGTFTVTIRPGSCSNGPPLPANLLQRTYTVVLAQTGANGTQVQGSIPGANMTVVSFFGIFAPAQERWNLSFAIGERLSDGNALTFNGSAFISVADLAGEFNGRIALNNPTAEDAIARCDGSRFSFVLGPA